MALVHGDFQHEMWDGALAQDEVSRLGIRGVPVVFADGQLLHVGKQIWQRWSTCSKSASVDLAQHSAGRAVGNPAHGTVKRRTPGFTPGVCAIASAIGGPGCVLSEPPFYLFMSLPMRDLRKLLELR